MSDRDLSHEERGDAIPLRDGRFAEGHEDEAESLVDRPSVAPPRPDPSWRFNGPAAASILAYCASSICMTVVNKFVVSGEFWNLTVLYLAMQAIICLVFIVVAKHAGFITDLAPLTRDKLKQWFPVALVLAGMLYTSTRALQYLSVPVYTIFKNLTIIVIAYGEVFLFGSKVTRLALFAFSLMVASSLIAAWADIQSALVGHMGDDGLATLHAGYIWMALNVVCSAAYVLGVRKFMKSIEFKDWDTMYYNNFLSLPIFFVFSLATEDWSRDNMAKNFPQDQRTAILSGIVASGVAAILISFCSVWCIRVTSSTTYSMVGALNKLPIAISGLVFFAAPVTFGSVSAIFVGFISGIIYAVAKNQDIEERLKVIIKGFLLLR